MAYVKKGRGGRWNEGFIITIYKYSVKGATKKEIAGACNVPWGVFKGWMRDQKWARDAYVRGRKDRGMNGDEKKGGGQGGMVSPNLRDFLHGRLSERMRGLWDQIMMVDKTPDPVGRLFNLTKRLDKIDHQRLFLYAVTSGNFTLSEACRRVGISRTGIKGWLKDPEFVELLDEVQEIKKDFVEGALMEGVAKGDPYLIRFANQTLNKDRGYGITFKVEGKVDINHNLLGPEDFLNELDEATALKVVEAMDKAMLRKKKEKEVIELQKRGNGVYSHPQSNQIEDKRDHG